MIVILLAGLHFVTDKRVKYRGYISSFFSVNSGVQQSYTLWSGGRTPFSA